MDNGFLSAQRAYEAMEPIESDDMLDELYDIYRERNACKMKIDNLTEEVEEYEHEIELLKEQLRYKGYDDCYLTDWRE